MIAMALISDLVTELSVMSGMPQETVAGFARYLREAGLLSQKGRGRGAARATALDAARLCTALMVGGRAKDAPQAVADFRVLEAWNPRKRAGEDYPDLTLEAVSGLTPGHRFDEALAALVGAWADADLVAKMAAFAGPEAQHPVMSASLNVSGVTGYISFGSTRYAYSDAELAQAVRSLQDGARPQEIEGKINPAMRRTFRYFSGIRTTRELTGAELRPLGEVVADMRPPGQRDHAETWQQIISGNPEFLRREIERRPDEAGRATGPQDG